MPRSKRLIIPETPHHITQRTVRRFEMFHKNSDFKKYLEYLLEACDHFQVEIYAYCLMTNHIHLILVPSDLDSLARVMRSTHSNYARYFNSIYGFNGHLMQARFYSCPLDETHFLAALKYVERNPVEAKMVQKCEDYFWSSARAHCGLYEDNTLAVRLLKCMKIPDWAEWINESNEQQLIDRIRRSTSTGKWARQGDGGNRPLVSLAWIED